MEFFPSQDEAIKPDPATVPILLPALSIGNVGQLAVDLIISTLRARRVGFLDEPHVLPCIGNDPYYDDSEGQLAVALEVYDDLSNSLRIVQQRAPVLKGTMMKFAKHFAAWASENKTQEVIILSGIDSGKRPMKDVGSSPLRYISTSSEDGTDPRCEKLGWKKFEHFVPEIEPWKLLESQCSSDSEEVCQVQLTDEMYYPSLPFASLFSCCKVRGLNVLCILFYCSEGDNIQDAFLLSESVSELLSQRSAGLGNLQWAVPHSWRSVYGPPPDPAMFY